MRNVERRTRTLGDIGMRLLIFALAAVLLMALQITGQLRPLQSLLATVTAPAQTGASGAADNVTDLVTFLTELRTLRGQVNQLQERNASLLTENLALREVEQENERLRQLLGFANTRPGLELRGAQIVARVIAEEPNNFLEDLTIDLGARHGIEVGMPVVNDEGLIGRISSVNDTTSVVMLITDPSSSFNAVLQSSRLNGVVNGQPGGQLVMDLIPQRQDFEISEVVLTSSQSEKYPVGIPIGRVRAIEGRDIDVHQRAVLDPMVDFSSLETVLVVTNFDPTDVGPAFIEQAAPTATPPAATEPPPTGETLTEETLTEETP
jgi:rod shape-determining protein MreC